MARVLLVVDVATVSEPDHDHQQHVVLNRVDDAIVAYPDPKAGTPLQGSRGRRSWIFCEQRDRALDPTPYLRIELAQGANGRRAKLDAVGAHSQPRSALT